MKTPQQIGPRVQNLLAGLQGKVRAQHEGDRKRAEAAVRHKYWLEEQRLKAIAEYGELLWRAMPFFGLNRFVTDLLQGFQNGCTLTRVQRDALERTVAWCERQGREAFIERAEREN